LRSLPKSAARKMKYYHMIKKAGIFWK